MDQKIIAAALAFQAYRASKPQKDTRGIDEFFEKTEISFVSEKGIKTVLRSFCGKCLPNNLGDVIFCGIPNNGEDRNGSKKMIYLLEQKSFSEYQQLINSSKLHFTNDLGNIFHFKKDSSLKIPLILWTIPWGFGGRIYTLEARSIFLLEINYSPNDSGMIDLIQIQDISLVVIPTQEALLEVFGEDIPYTISHDIHSLGGLIEKIDQEEKRKATRKRKISEETLPDQEVERLHEVLTRTTEES